MWATNPDVHQNLCSLLTIFRLYDSGCTVNVCCMFTECLPNLLHVSPMFAHAMNPVIIKSVECVPIDSTIQWIHNDS